MTKEELDIKEQEVWDTFKKGGPFAHNIIGMTLIIIERHNKERADKIYKELQDQGF